MVVGYWSVGILFWQLSIDHIVNVQCKRCGLGKTRLRHPSLPFDSLLYPTRTIHRRVRTYVRSVNHMTTKGKEVDHNLWVWGSVPRAPRARGSPANRGNYFTIRRAVLLKADSGSGLVSILCSRLYVWYFGEGKQEIMKQKSNGLQLFL